MSFLTIRDVWQSSTNGALSILARHNLWWSVSEECSNLGETCQLFISLFLSKATAFNENQQVSQALNTGCSKCSINGLSGDSSASPCNISNDQPIHNGMGNRSGGKGQLRGNKQAGFWK